MIWKRESALSDFSLPTHTHTHIHYFYINELGKNGRLCFLFCKKGMLGCICERRMRLNPWMYCYNRIISIDFSIYWTLLCVSGLNVTAAGHKRVVLVYLCMCLFFKWKIREILMFFADQFSNWLFFISSKFHFKITSYTQNNLHSGWWTVSLILVCLELYWKYALPTAIQLNLKQDKTHKWYKKRPLKME